MTRQRKWFYGIFGALFALILLFYGLILIFTYRGTPEAIGLWNLETYEKAKSLAATDQQQKFLHLMKVRYILLVTLEYIESQHI